MKALKAAAVVAGSLVIAGAAAPAFASDMPSDIPPMSLNGGLNDALTTITNQPTLVSPVDTNLLDPKHEKSLVDTVAETVNGLKSKGGTNAPSSLLGGLPLG
ncbi:hypothetical protein OKJ48_05215 [Streptomyces kunmingensis]|uniref:Secreted protein n=1 Tax=Streptomyces kunmingensis TaxID=68225 RepID=A0ABU6C4J6_9ACTN|nr:hypothetical protein [Streptomyces kunmingensis]MEB3959650.1 hypothetical protein [Streptomyces kunmingensis]